MSLPMDLLRHEVPEENEEIGGLFPKLGDLLEKGLPVEIGSRPGSALFTYERTGHAIVR